MTDYFPLLLVFLLVTIGFVHSMKHGVYKILSSGCAMATTLFVWAVLVQLLPAVGGRLFEGASGGKLTLVVAGIAAVVAFIVARIVFGIILKWIFGPGSPFHRFVDGLPGGILSLFASLTGALILLSGFRVAGTVMEMNYIASLSQPEVSMMGGQIPGYPKPAVWRNSVESIPGFPMVLDVIDPFSNRTDRNAAALIVVSKSGALRSHLLADSETKELAADEEIDKLRREADVMKAVDSFDWVSLILNSKVKDFAGERERSRELKKLKLEPVLVGFVNSIEPPESGRSATQSP